MDKDTVSKEALCTDNCRYYQNSAEIMCENEYGGRNDGIDNEVNINSVDIEVMDSPGSGFNNNTSTDDSASDYDTAFENVIEKIEDRRYSTSDLTNHTSMRNTFTTFLHRRATSENDMTIAGGISMLKSKVEDKIRSSGKMCKECFVQSIQSHLSKLGIVNTYEKHTDDKDDNEIENGGSEDTYLFANEKEKKGESSKSDGHKNVSSLLKSLHRRTLSEIDWHELTRFAQGELFEPESSTAREIKRVIEDGKDELSVAFKMMHQMDFDYVVEEAEKCVQCVLNTGWRVVSHWELPQWLRDNDFLWHMHRPQLPSFKECFCSMFRIHTETGNIWTHFFGLILILIAMMIVYFRTDPIFTDFPSGWEEYTVFTAFFIGAIMCLGFSWLFHTCSCHSKKASKLLSKLDYAGIAFMIMGSFVPCVYYGFYCKFYEKVAYLASEVILGFSSIIVALWDKFATPSFRPIRAGVFLALGCSGVIPVVHMLIIHGVERGSQQGAVGWLILMGLSYIIGAILYALRVPERFFPGKCNLVFQSHQIFHVLVVAGALIHLHGCCQMAAYRVKIGRNCTNPLYPARVPNIISTKNPFL